MPTFKKYKLGDLSDKITKGTTPTSLGGKFVPHGINFIKAESVTLDGQIDKSRFAFIDTETDEKLKRSRLEENDILFSMAGIILGKTAIVKKEHLPANTNQALALIRLKKGIANPEYIHYYFRQKSVFEWVNSITAQSAQPNINLAEIGDIDIPLPDLPTQTRIASILSSLDDKIELNRRTNHTLEQIAQTLFKKYFVDDIDPENLPEGWRLGKLGEICDVNLKTLSKNDKLDWINYVEISEVNQGYIANIARYKRGTEPSRARRIIKHGDTILSTVRPDRGSYFLAINPESELLVSTGFAVFTPTKAPYSFIYLFLTQEESISYYGFMAHGAAYPAINPEIILKMEVPIPPKNIFDEFHFKTESLLLKFSANIKQSKYLSEIRDSLLPKLMSGEIEVNVAEKELAQA